MRLQTVGKAMLMAMLAGGVLPPSTSAQAKATTSDPPSTIEGTAPAHDSRYGYVRLALKRIQQKHPQLKVPHDVVQIVVDNKKLAKALGFSPADARQMDQGFMYTLTENGQFARPTFLNVKSKVWDFLIANLRRDDQVEPVVCVLAASLEHEIVGHMLANDHDEFAPTELEVATLRECAQGGLVDHPSIAGRLAWLNRQLQALKNRAPVMTSGRQTLR